MAIYFKGGKMMFMGRVEVYSKFKTYLVAYKDIPDEAVAEIGNNSIMIINKPINVNEDNQKGCCGLNTRICIYLRWFKEEINDALKEGYTLALIESRKNQMVFPDLVIKDLIIKYPDIKILSVQEL